MDYYNQNQFSLGNNNYNEENEFQTEGNQIKQSLKNKTHQITIPKNRYSRSPKESLNRKQIPKSKFDSFKKSSSPKYKIRRDLNYDDNLNYAIVKNEMNIIEGDEEESKKLKMCQKGNLPKEKTYIIKETNFQKVMDIIKKTEKEKKYLNELNIKNEEQIKKKK